MSRTRRQNDSWNWTGDFNIVIVWRKWGQAILLDCKSLATMTRDLVGAGDQIAICHPSMRTIAALVLLHN